MLFKAAQILAIIPARKFGAENRNDRHRISRAEKLIKAVDDMVSDKDLLKENSKNASAMAITDACERIYSIVKDIVK